MTANSSPSNPSDDVFALIGREQGRYLAELKEYLRIPSISTDSNWSGTTSPGSPSCVKLSP